MTMLPAAPSHQWSSVATQYLVLKRNEERLTTGEQDEYVYGNFPCYITNKHIR